MFRRFSHIFIAIFFLFSFHINAQNNREKLNLKGNVKFIKTTPYLAFEKFGKITKGEILSEKIDYDISTFVDNEISLIQFNLNGFKTMSEYYKDGELTRKHSFNYNTKNQCISQNNYSVEYARLNGRVIRKFNEFGLLSEYDEFNSDNKLESKIIIKYNGNGKEIDKSIYNAEGNLESKYLYEYKPYAKVNQLKITKSFDKKGLLEYTDQEIFSEDGKLLHHTRKNEKKKSITVTDHKYDGKRNLIYSHEVWSWVDEKTGVEFELYKITTYWYNDNQILVMKTFEEKSVTKETPPFTSSEITTLKYNQFGDLTEIRKTEGPKDEIKLLFSLDYEYDTHNNWIKKIVKFNAILTKFLVEREIEYFN